MNRYSKMLLSLLLTSATALFVCGITTGRAFAVQDEAIEQMTDEEYEAYEAEYEIWETADKETDILKSGTMLFEFLQKNPKSLLVPHAESSYMRLLARCIEEKKYQELLTLAEQWNAFRPGNEDIIRMIVLAAGELKHAEKYLWALEELYKHTTQLDIAKRIAGIYKEEMKNDAKYIEWVEIILKGPGEESNFPLLYDLFHIYSNKKDTARMMEYAPLVLKAIDQLQNPSPDIAKVLPDIRNALHHAIGVMHYNEKKYDDAITYFLRALRDKKYSNGYWMIGNILWEQNRILNARLAFAKAQILGESAEASEEDKAIAPRAKENMEKLHRALQNNTLIGIDRQYTRAREISDEDLIKPMN